MYERFIASIGRLLPRGLLSKHMKLHKSDVPPVSPGNMVCNMLVAELGSVTRHIDTAPMTGTG